MKTCVSCGVSKPLTEYHKCSGMRDGRVSKCRECKSRYNREYYLKNKDRVKAIKRAYYEANVEAHAANYKKWYEENREQRLLSDKQWKEANRDRVKAYVKAWKQEHPDRVRAYSKKYYEANAEACAVRNKARREADPEPARSRERKRRALLASVESEPYTVQQVVDRDGTKCPLCGVEVDLSLAYPDPLSRSIDHIVPISLGGPDVLSNVQLTHLRCNISKGNRVSLPNTN